MERILVAIDAKRGAWAALSHACSLAKRMDVDLNVLLVNSVCRGGGRGMQCEIEHAVKKRLELLLEGAKAEGITINYFIAEGAYEDEVIQFVNHHRIALLVHETRGGDVRASAKDAVSLRALRHRLNCRMEVVAPMKIGA